MTEIQIDHPKVKMLHPVFNFSLDVVNPVRYHNGNTEEKKIKGEKIRCRE
jgi:hypothetical protein